MPENYLEDASVLNAAVSLSLEWGENWLLPVNKRVMHLFPHLTAEDAEALNKKCKEIQQYSWGLFHQVKELRLTMDNAVGKIIPLIRLQYPLLNEANVSRLASQGMYYSLK